MTITSVMRSGVYESALSSVGLLCNQRLIEAIFRRRVSATRRLAVKRSGEHAYAMNDTETDY